MVPARVRLAWPPLVLLAILTAGCRQDTAATVPEEEVLARIDGQPITKADLEKQLADRSAFVRQRFASPEKRKELLDSLVRFEVLAREAQARGYDRDPEVIRQQKQRAIDRMMAEELANQRPEAIPEGDVRAFYQAHQADFSQPEAIRLEQIVVKDAAKAKTVAARARALSPRDAAGFAKLVEQHSEHADSKGRQGDLGFLERGTAGEVPREVLDAGWALAAGNDKVGLVTGPVMSPQGHHILRLAQRRAGFARPLESVETEIRRRLGEQRRRGQVEAWVADARRRVKIEIFEDRLKEIKVPTDVAPAAKP